MNAVNFFYQKTGFYFKNRNQLKKCICHVFLTNKKKLAQLNYIFCSDEYLLEINKQFLKHNYYTDIITFDISDNKNEITGEVYISIDRVFENAKNHHQSFTNELHRVVFHGALHLCGFNDKSLLDKKNMRKNEEKWLSHYFNK